MVIAKYLPSGEIMRFKSVSQHDAEVVQLIQGTLRHVFTYKPLMRVWCVCWTITWTTFAVAVCASRLIWTSSYFFSIAYGKGAQKIWRASDGSCVFSRLKWSHTDVMEDSSCLSRLCRFKRVVIRAEAEDSHNLTNGSSLHFCGTLCLNNKTHGPFLLTYYLICHLHLYY